MWGHQEVLSRWVGALKHPYEFGVSDPTGGHPLHVLQGRNASSPAGSRATPVALGGGKALCGSPGLVCE